MLNNSSVRCHKCSKRVNLLIVMYSVHTKTDWWWQRGFFRKLLFSLGFVRHFHYAIEPAAPFWPCSSQSCDTCINSIMNKTCVVLAYGLYFNMTDTFKRLLWLIVEGPVLIITQSSLSCCWPLTSGAKPGPPMGISPTLQQKRRK